jgi:hypothetical protein
MIPPALLRKARVDLQDRPGRTPVSPGFIIIDNERPIA